MSSNRYENQYPMWDETKAFISLFDSSAVRIEAVSTNRIVQLQQRMSKAIWRPAPGRKLGFVIYHGSQIIGVAFLASPVINMGARDQHLGLSTDPTKRGQQLRHYADLSVCVASQPFGWYWNGGKLIAMIATSLGNYWTDRYGDDLRGIVTTSLWGKGSQYNRLYKFLGYTKGFGHCHIDDEKYEHMMQWMRDNDVDIPSSKFGSGSNSRMRRIQAYRSASGDDTITLQHGQRRGIYYHSTTDPHNRLALICNWYERWGLPRYQRKQNEIPPYMDGLS